MHVQIINFRLQNLSEEGYAKICDQVAQAFAEVPGLLSKVWIADSSSGTYGGVYFWKDREAMENFAKTDLFNTVATHPNLRNITSKDFSVMEEPTRITRGFGLSD